MTLRSVNPASGELICEYDAMDDRSVEALLGAVHATTLEWGEVPLEERCDLARRLGVALSRKRMVLARIMTTEMGKPLSQSVAEVEKCAALCEHYADNGRDYLADEAVETGASRCHVAYRPLGVVLGVMPWNFPFWQVMRFAVPALTAGNTCVLKHASNVSGCALAIESLFREAGYPEHALRAALVPGERVASIVGDDRVAAVTLTGSEEAGRAVAEASGRALKKVVLELGGSDPYVVLEDADLEVAAEACVTSRLINSGQSCIAAKRFIVPGAIREEFTEAVVASMGEAVMGDPMDDATTVGPLARRDLRDSLHSQVQRSLDSGARLLLGGDVPDRDGAWYPPSVLTDVAPGMAAHDEELFGPVAAIVPAQDDDDALRLANATRFGLGAAVFTTDVERGERIARERLHAGCCFVNSYVRSDPRVPFGGVKASGHGRELGRHGIREFVNVKTVWVR